MFNLKIKDVMLARGIKPTAYYLQRGAGFSYSRANYLLSDRVKSIKLAELAKLCLLLNCTPKQLLKISPQEADELPAKHPLRDWKSRPGHTIVDHLRLMPPEKLKEAEELLRKLRED